MKGETENSQVDVLINLSSRLLCEALRGLMEKDAIYRIAVAHDPDKFQAFAPLKILVDAVTLEHPSPPHWIGAKVILVDTGLSENELIRLLSLYRLDGVISTDTGCDLFWKALEIIRAGQVWIDNSKIRSILHSRVPVRNSTAQVSYSKREREIVLSIVEGSTNRQIAAHLNISEQTVKTHVSRIFKKANVISRAQLGPLALKFKSSRLICPEHP